MAQYDPLIKNIVARKQKEIADTRASRQTGDAATVVNEKQQRYQSIYSDMTANPRKYYDAFNGNVKQYNRELAYYQYMGGISSLNLPDEYTHYAYVLDDMRSNKQKYLDAFGGSVSKYNSELNRVTELYGIEQDNAAPVIELVQDRVPYSALQTWGLDKYYSYDESNADDVLLQQLGYAPSSFYTKTDLAKREQAGYALNKYITYDEDGNLDERSMYLLTYGGGYDESNPEDILNAALGLMPSSFSYANNATDQARKAAGLLPEEVDTWVNNSEQYAKEYDEYVANVQKYTDEMYVWSNLPGIVRLFKPKPKDPYPDGVGVPETVQAVQGYKSKLSAGIAQTPYEKYSGDEKEIAPLDFYYDEAAPVYYSTDRKAYKDGTIDPTYFQASEEAKLQAEITNDPGRIGELYSEGRLTEEQVGAAMATTTNREMAEVAAQEVTYNDTIQKMKDEGTYDDFLQFNDDVKAAITEGYSPENYALLKENLDFETALGMDGGLEELQKIAVDALNGGKAKDLNEFLGNKQGEDWRGEEISSYQIADDAEIQRIRASLKSLGWNGEATSENAQIQGLLDQATHRAMQLQYAQVEKHKELLGEMPAWLVASINGFASGVDNFVSSVSELALKGAKTQYNIFGSKEYNAEMKAQLEGLAEDVATSNQARGYRNTAYNMTAKNAGALTNTWYNVVSTATEMGIEMAIGGAIGKIGAAGAATAETVQTIQDVSRWSKIAKKLVLSKQMTPFFVASLGHNLMYGQLQGRTDLENWAAALPAAYIESVLEGCTGFFSTPNVAGKLFQNGIRGMAKQTLANAGRAILENTLGEAIEENLQDLTTSLIQHLMWRGDKDAIFSLDQMGQTTVTTIGVGLLLSLFGIPAGFRSYNNSKNVENFFNAAVEAYEAGDMRYFEKHMAALKNELGALMSNLEIDMEEGNIEKVMGYLQFESNVGNAMDSLYNGAKGSMQLRQKKAAGEQVTQGDIDLMDAQAAGAIQALRTFQGFESIYATELDQVKASPELTLMLNNGGFTADLIANNGQVLTSDQLNILRRTESEAQKNPYINTQFADTTTAESLQGEVKNANEKLTTAKADQKAFAQQAKEKISAAYKQGKQQGKAMHDSMVEQGKRLTEGISALQDEATKANQRVAAYQYQQQVRAAFSKPQESANAQRKAKKVPFFERTTGLAGAINRAADRINGEENITGEEPATFWEAEEARDTAQAEPVAATPSQESTVNEQTPSATNSAPQTGAQRFINDADVVIPPYGDSGYIYSDQYVQDRAEKRETTFTRVIMEQRKKNTQASPQTRGGTDEITLYQQARDAVEKYHVMRDQINDQPQEGDNAAPQTKLIALREQAEAAVNRLMNKINISSIMEEVRKSFVFDEEIQNASITTVHLQTRESIKANLQVDPNPLTTFEALENSLDIIAHENERAVIEEAQAVAHDNDIDTNEDVVESLRREYDRPSNRAAEKLKGAASNIFGVGSMNGDQMATSIGGNRQSAWSDLLWKRASECYNKRCHLYLNDMLYTHEFTDTLPAEFRSDMVKRKVYSMELQNKTDHPIGLAMNDIINIWGNMKAGNNLLPGFKLLLGKGQEINEGEITYEELADIANVIDGENVNERTQAIIDAIGPENLANMRKVADFAWKFYNERYYTNRYGERIEAPRARMDIMGYEVYGITRSRGNYWPTQSMYEHPSRGTIAETEARTPKRTSEHVKGENKGKVILSDILGMFDVHSYETAHALAYGLYQRELYQMLYRYGLSDQVRTKKGEQYQTWLKEYRQNIFKPNERMSEVEGLAKFLYNNVKLAKLIAPSVWVQQLAGVVHAGAYLDGKYYPALKQFGKLTAEQEDIWRNYTPSVALRSMGYSAKETAEAAFTHAKRVEWAMKPLVAMDVKACKVVLQWAYNQVKGEQPNLQGEAFKQAVGELARHTVERTQGTYAPHTVSMFSTHQTFTARFLTMFTTQTNAQYNTIIGGLKDLGTPGLRKRGLKKLNAVVMSSVAAWILSGIVGGGFADWKEESTLDKVLNIASILTGNVYLVRNIQGLMQYQNIDIPVFEQISDIWAACTSISSYNEKKRTAQEKYEETGDESYLKSIKGYDRHIGGQVKQIVFAFSALAGVPAKAAEKYVITRPLQIAANTFGSEWAVTALSDWRSWQGYDLQPSANYPDFNDALTSGKYDRAVTYAKIIINKGGNINNYMSAATGGKALTPEQQYRATQAWNDAVIQLGLDERATGE